MTCRIVIGGLLLALGHCLPAAAQPVPVRDTSTVGVIEQLDLAVRRALVPWSVDVAPLHAYNSDLICRDRAHSARLAAHRGTAAIVFASDGNFVASYHRTVNGAIRAAEQMCGSTNIGWTGSEAAQPSDAEPSDDSRPNITNWYFATTYPLPDTDAERHFMSRDVEGIAETLAAGPDR